MRITEFLTEQQLSDIDNALEMVSLSLPSTYVIPELQNQDFYRQYRFGIAVAAVRGEEGKDSVFQTRKPKFQKETIWGENQIVSSYEPNIEKVVRKALAKIGVKNKKSVSSKHSHEMIDINKGSPVKAFKGYPK
jgi:hypothetical protein